MKHYRNKLTATEVSCIKKLYELQKLIEDKGFLVATGCELEFFLRNPDDSEIDDLKLERKITSFLNENDNYDFEKSSEVNFRTAPYIQRLYKELKATDKYEITFGKLNGAENQTLLNVKKSSPHTIALVSSICKNIIEQETEILTGYKALFKPTSPESKSYTSSIQTSISIWKGNQNLLADNLDTQLSSNLVEGIVEAQNILFPLAVKSQDSIDRFSSGISSPKEISTLKRYITKSNSVAFREKEGRIENRLSGSDVSPAISMLISIVGVQIGLNNYFKGSKIEDNKIYDIPKTSEEIESSRTKLANNIIVQKILGKEFITGIMRELNTGKNFF